MMTMGGRAQLAVLSATVCLLLFGAFVVNVRRAGRGGGAAQGSVLGEQRAYTWGIPTTLGGLEPKRRVPVRSTDSMGQILPEMADEVQPPGPFKLSGATPALERLIRRGAKLYGSEVLAHSLLGVFGPSIRGQAS